MALVTETGASSASTSTARPSTLPPGASALDAINAAGVYVPQLCKDPDQNARGACRTCLVQIEGMRGFPASCTTPCTDGMQIKVNSPEAQRIRRGVIELTMGMHPDACQTNRPNTHNDVVDAARAHGIETPRFAPLPDPSVDDEQPVLRPRHAAVHPVRSLRDGVRRRPAHRRHLAARARRVDEDRHVRRPAAARVDLHVVRLVLRRLSDGCDLPEEGSPRARQAGRDHLPVLRRRLRHQARCHRRRADRALGRRAAQRLQPGHAVRQGPLRLRVRQPSRPADDAADPTQRHARGSHAGTRRSTWSPTSSSSIAARSARWPRPRAPTKTATSSRSSCAR